MAIDNVCSGAYTSLIDGLYDYSSRFCLDDAKSIIEASILLVRVTADHATPFDLSEQEIRTQSSIVFLRHLCDTIRPNDHFEALLPVLKQVAQSSMSFRQVLAEYSNYQKTDQGMLETLSDTELARRINSISR